jgi:hypothetical protein
MVRGGCRRRVDCRATSEPSSRDRSHVHEHRLLGVTASHRLCVVKEANAIVFAALAACGVSSTPATTEPPAEQPDEFEPTEPIVKPIESHWCCQSVDPQRLFDGRP